MHLFELSVTNSFIYSFIHLFIFRCKGRVGLSQKGADQSTAFFIISPQRNRPKDTTHCPLTTMFFASKVCAHQTQYCCVP